MDFLQLEQKLDGWTEKLDPKDKRALLVRLKSLKSVFPFNEFEFRLMYLLNHKVITFEEYEALRNSYSEVNANLELYGLAPRIFGEIWAQQHLADVDSRFIKPSKKIDAKYVGDYDLYIQNGNQIIRVEVKAARAINTKRRGNLVEKALGFTSQEPFWMNFQQIKLTIVEAFVFIGVWTDTIRYWVLSNNEAKNHPNISHQHRGGVEYQIGITDKNIKTFDQFLVEPKELVDRIIYKYLLDERG